MHILNEFMDNGFYKSDQKEECKKEMYGNQSKQ